MAIIRLNGGAALLRSLAAERPPFVFGVVGGKLGPFLHALSLQDSIRYVGARHEAHAAMMAVALSAGTGQLGVVVAECGSGGGNVVPGVAIAHANHWPLLVLTSNNQHAASYPPRGMFAGMDTQALLHPITKWNSAVHEGRRLPELMHEALRAAHTGRPGPVHLDIPQDVLRGTLDYDESEFPGAPARYRVTANAAADPDAIAAVAEMLLLAERPLLLAGGGVVASNATNELRALAEELDAAVLGTHNAVGIVPTSDPRYLGLGAVIGGDAVRRAFDQADVILAVGCRFSSWLWDGDGRALGRQARLAQIDLDPQRLGAGLPLEVALCADARVALTALLDAVRARRPSSGRRAWLVELRGAAARWRRTLNTLADDAGMPMHPAALARAVGEHLPREALAVFDGGHTTFWSNDFTPASEPRTRFNEPGMSQLGFGLPAAIALQLAHPGRPVFNLTGDGAFGFSIQELDTARRLKLPVVNVVHNNGDWGIIRYAYDRAGTRLEDSLEGTDYAAIARGFGCHGETVTRAAEIALALERARASGLPAVLDCRVRFEPHPCLPDFAKMSSARGE